jgi:hypothetical protein
LSKSRSYALIIGNAYSREYCKQDSKAAGHASGELQTLIRLNGLMEGLYPKLLLMIQRVYGRALPSLELTITAVAKGNYVDMYAH